MSIIRCRIMINTAIALTLLAATVAVYAQGKSLIKPALSGFVERAVGGRLQKIALDQAERVSPGETLYWVLRSANSGNSPANNYRAVGAISKGTVFIADSASGEGQPTVTYSIDHGESFSARPMVEEKQPDGTVKRVPAPVTRYTHVCLAWREPLAGGASLAAYYQTRVR